MEILEQTMQITLFKKSIILFQTMQFFYRYKKRFELPYVWADPDLSNLKSNLQV